MRCRRRYTATKLHCSRCHADMQSVFSFLAGALYVVGYVPYIRSIVFGQSKPAKASWIIWTALDMLTIAAMFAKGTISGQLVGSFIGSWCIALLAFRYGIPGWKKLDVICLLGGASGIFLWQYYRDSTYGIVIGQVTMLIGCIPTYVSAWKNPEHEDRLAWTIYFFSCIPALLAISQWNLASATQPIAFLISETGMMILLWIKPRITNRSIEARS